MEKPLVFGFDICINGVRRTFRDEQPTAYNAASVFRADEVIE